MATTQSPHTGSEPSSFSPGQSAITEPGTRKRKASHSLPRPAVREIGLMRDTGGKDSARFVGSSSGIHFIRNVHLRLARQSASRTQHVPGEGDHGEGIGELVPGEDDQLRRRATERDGARVYLWKDHEVSTDEGATPSFDQLVDWSKSYFESWHPILPFLHGPDVLLYFEDVSQTGFASLDHLDRCILRSVLSMCLADSRQGNPLKAPIPASLLFGTVDEAVSSSQFALCQPASIRATQAALSIQLFLTSMLCLNAASRLGGLVVRMAFHLGLHRCPTRFPFFTPEQAALRRRVFWCIYCCERFLCQSLGLPLDIQDDDIDVCYPYEEEHGAVNDEENDKRLQLLTYMAKHAKIRGQILELRNKAIVTRQDTADRATVVQTELSRWSNEIQDTVEEVELADETEDSDRAVLSSSHRLVLLLSKYESLISLNRPMMASDASTPSWSAAMQACISAAKSICITMRRHAQKNGILKNQRRQTLISPMLWPSFTWAVWISAFVLAYAAFEQQMPLESALRHIESSKDILRHIATRNTSWPEYCLSALDELTSAVRESSSMRGNIWNIQGTDAAQSGVGRLNGAARPLNRDEGTEQVPPLSHAAQQRRAGQSDANISGFPQVVASSPGLLEEARSQVVSSDPIQPPSLEWQRNRIEHPQVASPRQGYSATPGLSGAPQANAAWNYQQPLLGPGSGQFPSGIPNNGADSGPSLIPGEGQESAMWYDQLFATSFSAIDNPLLAAAHLDPSIDPTWSYLR